MILLDPDLEPDAASQRRRPLRGKAGAAPNAIRGGRGLTAPGVSVVPRNHRLPTAATLARFLREAQSAVRLRGQVTVLLTTDAAICKLNRRFRGKNKATDVLSFPAQGVGAEEMAGDVAISVPTALRQASEHGHALGVEIKVLMLHGLLHLAGYDHEADAGRMARRERVLRGRLGLPQGLIERAGAKLSIVRKIVETCASGAIARTNLEPLKYGLKPVPFRKASFTKTNSVVSSSAHKSRMKAKRP